MLLPYNLVFLFSSPSSVWLHTFVAAGSVLSRQNHSVTFCTNFPSLVHNFVISLYYLVSKWFAINIVIIAFLPDRSYLGCRVAGYRQSLREAQAAPVCTCPDSSPWEYRVCPGNGSTPPIQHKQFKISVLPKNKLKGYIEKAHNTPIQYKYKKDRKLLWKRYIQRAFRGV